MRDLLEELEAGGDPLKAARASQQRPLPRRFYAEVSLGEDEGNFRILLDGKPVRTPARAIFAVPHRGLGEVVAEEWRRQETEINPHLMPLTRLINVALDGVARDPEASAAEIVRYAGSDLICYRAEGPEKLVERQNAAWNPVLDWLRVEHGARFILSAGIMHVVQPEETLARIDAMVPRDPLRLAALVSLTSLLGSALLALALLHRKLTPDAAWAAAHVDEDWNIAQWGEDELAAQRRAARETEMRAGAEILRHLG